jgi:hypothetical protein
VYLVRKPDYGLADVAPRMRTRVRRGLERCTVRRLSAPELAEQGLPLNQDTLQRQGRSDALFTRPERWAALCQAAAACSALEVWGAFAGQDLAAYSMVMQTGPVAVILYQMSRTAHLPLEVNPALNFTQAYELARRPGVAAVSFGHVGLDSTDGLDRYKRALGYQLEPLTFAVELRRELRPLLVSGLTRAVARRLRQRRPESHLLQRLEAVLEIAAQSAGRPGRAQALQPAVKR